MPRIMADYNVEGHLDVLLRIWTSPVWNDLWQQMGCHVESFQRHGIAPDMPDAELGRFCQEQQIILLTGNRNAEGEDSLEITIRNNRTDTTLPVLTIATPAQVIIDRAYAERVAERILEYLLDLQNLRGVGRLYVPKDRKSAGCQRRTIYHAPRFTHASNTLGSRATNERHSWLAADWRSA